MSQSGPDPGFAEAVQRLGLFGAVLAGVVGLVVAIFCFFVPGLHFILGPFGPFLGGFVAGRLSGPGPARIALAAGLIAVGLATLTAAFSGLLFDSEVEGGLARVAPFVVLAYSAFFGTIGCAIGGLTGGGGRR